MVGNTPRVITQFGLEFNGVLLAIAKSGTRTSTIGTAKYSNSAVISRASKYISAVFYKLFHAMANCSKLGVFTVILRSTTAATSGPLNQLANNEILRSLRSSE